MGGGTEPISSQLQCGGPYSGLCRTIQLSHTRGHFLES